MMLAPPVFAVTCPWKLTKTYRLGYRCSVKLGIAMFTMWPFNCMPLVMVWLLVVVYLLHLLKPEEDRRSMCWELVGPGTKYKK